MARPANLVEMGGLGKAVGLKGELYLIWHGESLPGPGHELYLEAPPGELKRAAVQALRFHKGRLVVLLEGVSDRTEAERLRGAPVFMDRSRLDRPGENEAFLADILGSGVYLADGSLAGVLDHAEFPAGRQLWAIRREDGKEILFPAEPCFIDAIIPEERKIVISPPPGLFEIYDA